MREKIVVLGFSLTVLALFILYFLSPFIFPPHYKELILRYKIHGEYLHVKEIHYVTLTSYANVVYRSFAEEICLKNGDCNIRILSVKCSYGTPYISLYYGVKSPKGIPRYIGEKIMKNEVGCWFTKPAKEVKLVVEYEVPIYHVKYNHWTHYVFSKEHLAIRKLVVNALNANKTYFFLPADVPIKINVKDGRLNGLLLLYLQQLAILILGIILSLLPYLIWKKYGVDKEAVVPQYLHYVPTINGKKVDYVLANFLANEKLTNNVVAAALLSLWWKKVILNIKREGDKVTIVLDKAKLKSVDHPFEKELIERILKEGKITEEDDKLVVTVEREKIAYSILNLLSKYRSMFERELMERKGYGLFILWAIIYGGLLLTVFPKATVTQTWFAFMIVIIIGFMLLGLKPSLFGRFKGDWYKVKQEILAFKRFLEDLAMLRKYAPEDIVMWQEWLVYATSLEVASKVLKVFAEKFPLEVAREYEKVVKEVTLASAIITTPPQKTTYTTTTSRSSGVGTGGGFGGGGSGVR